MEIILQVACILLSLVAGTHAQPNLAAIWGLGALGDLGEGGMGGMAGLGGFNSLAGMNSGGSSSSNSNCPYQAHPNQFKFTQVVNNRVMTQECAPGTMFVLSKCSCDNIPTGGVPRAGSNPRLDIASLGGGGGNSLMNALMSQLQGGGSNPQLSAPPPVRNKAPQPVSNHINNGVRPRVSSGRRPDQGGSMGGQQPSAGIQYNPGTNSGLTSVVDPSILPNVLPPEIMQILQASSGLRRAPVAPNPTQASIRRSTMGRKPAAPTPTKNTRVDVSSLSKSGMPAEVLQMLQRSMGPPTSTKKARQSPNSNMPQRNIPRTGSNTARRIVPSPTRATRPRTPSQPVPTPTRQTNMKPQSGHRQDPLAALLASSISASRSQSTSSRSQPATRRTNTPQTNPLAAMMAGLGGNSLGGNSRSSSSQTGAGSNPMAALMATMAGGPMMGGSSGGNNAAMMAALMGGSSSGGLSRAGGPLDMTSLAGNVNVATLLGETPGPGLVQNVDMTALFNAQGQMGAGGGMAGLAGLNNINILKLQELDRQGVIDISDLTPMGLAAANAHFG